MEAFGFGSGQVASGGLGGAAPDGFDFAAAAGASVLAYSRNAPEAAAAPAERPQENGSATPVTLNTASGTATIDAMLAPSRWDAATISYSYPDAAADYGGSYASPGSLTGLGIVINQQDLLVGNTLDSDSFSHVAAVEDFTGLTIDFAGNTNGNGTIRIANHSGGVQAFQPSAANNGGDVFFRNGDFPTAGSVDWHDGLYALGLALGLRVPELINGLGTMPADQLSSEYTVMTFHDFVGDTDTSAVSLAEGHAPQTFMMHDIAALQWMYGVAYDTNAGDTVYRWTPGSGDTIIDGRLSIDAADKIFMTVWDGGGEDIYDLRAYTTGVTIDLRPGFASTFSQTQLADLGGGGGLNGDLAEGSVFNALRFGNDARSDIERAYGGSGDDFLIGNASDNYFLGGYGNDTVDDQDGGADDGNLGPGADFAQLYGGDDRMYGSNGNDQISGGTGSDRLIGDAGQDSLSGGEDNDRLFGGSGNDVLHGDEGADFIDGSGGDDLITGGEGADRLQGRQGNDDYFYTGPGSGADRIFGFEDDADELHIHQSHGFATAAAVAATATASGQNLVLNLGGGDTITLALFLTGGKTLGDIEDDIVIFFGVG